MFIVQGNGPAIARIPKNATQSIAMAMASPATRGLTNEEALEFPLRVMFVRDPFDRLASGYSFFTHIRQFDTKIIPPVPDFTTYEEYVDWALESGDPHVAPQVDQVTTKDGVFVPNRLYWLKDIHNVWNDLYPGMIPDKSDFPHRHHTQRLATTNYRRDEIAAKYAKDIELCRQL